MNLISFNQCAVAPFSADQIKAAAEIADFPLFVVDSGADIPADTIESLRLANLQELMPFDGIRIYDRMDDGRRINEWLGVVIKEPQQIRYYAHCYSIKDKATDKKTISPGTQGVSFIIHNQLDSKRAFFSRGKPVKEDQYDKAALDSYDNAARHVLFSFLACLMNPHLHLATVRPNKQGKSVEWTRQRTHFVFIHKSHQANTNGFCGQADLETDHIQRMAHSRRAHYRVLRHPKFRHKLGQKIRIKSCWIGPKEWQGNSGQIYRIVE